MGAVPIQTTTCMEMLVGKEISGMPSILPVYFQVCLVMSAFYRGKHGVKYIHRHLLCRLKSGQAGMVFLQEPLVLPFCKLSKKVWLRLATEQFEEIDTCLDVTRDMSPRVFALRKHMSIP